MPYEVGAPTIEDLEALDSVQSPLVYLDWNVMQYLRDREEAFPLLGAVLEPTTRASLGVPYSIAHLQDATANWPSLSREHRAARLRNMVFADGITEGTCWHLTQSESKLFRVSRGR